MLCKSLLALALMAASPCVNAEMFENPSFEAGLTPWVARGHTDCVRVDQTTAHEGARSVCFAPKRAGQYAEIRQTVKNRWPGKALELTFAFKMAADSDTEAGELPPGRLDYGVLLPVVKYTKQGTDGAEYLMDYNGAMNSYYYPYRVRERTASGWIVRTVRLNVPKEAEHIELTFAVSRFPGRVWLDDLRLREVPRYAKDLTDMWSNNAMQAELGKPLKARVNALFASGSPFIDRADAYNALLVQTALAQDEARTLLRAAAYAGDAAPGRDALRRVDALERELNVVYRAFQTLYFARKADRLAKEFDGPIEALAPKVAEQRQRMANLLADLQKCAGWQPLSASTPKPYAITPGGAPNQITFGKLSKPTHYHLERHMGLNRLLQTNYYTGDVVKEGPRAGELDWDASARRFCVDSSKGFEALGPASHFACHRGVPVSPKWFKENIARDPDIILSGFCGTGRASSTAPQANWWHPEVRREVRRQAIAAARALTAYPRVRYLAYAQEAGGPRLSGKGGRCMSGGGPHALADFHRYLQKHYGSIEKLNASWRTQYEGFDGIQLLPDSWQAEDPPKPCPVGYWQERWRMDSYLDWLKWIYDSFKQGAPNLPVMSSHCRISTRIQPARLFESADIIGYHASAHLSGPVTSMLQSMRRFAPKDKSLGQYETTWASQQWRAGPGDERLYRYATTAHTYQLALWDMHVQHFWYAYTSQPYMLHYNGNWFDPNTDCLTYRYCVGGMRVAIENMARLSDTFVTTRKRRSRVLMIYPTTVTHHQWQHAWEMPAIRKAGTGMWHFMRNHNVECEYLPEEFVLDGRERLDNYDVVILPFAPYMMRDLATRLIDWTRAGGTLITVGPFAVTDEMGFATEAPMKTLFGFAPTATANLIAEPTAWKGDVVDADGLCERPSGKGRALYIRFPDIRHLEMTDFFRHPLVDWLQQGTRGVRLLQALKTAGRFAVCERDQVQLYTRESADGGQVLFVFNPSPYVIAHETITLAIAASSVVDIAVPGAFPVPAKTTSNGTTFPVTLAPGQLAAYRIQ